MRKNRAAAVAVALAVILGAGLAPVRAAEPLKLRISWAVIPGQLTAVLFQNPTILEHYGKSYTVELTHFRGSTPQIMGLASGDLSFASLAFSSFGLAIQNAHLNDIRAVADLYQDGIPGYYTNEYMVRTDSGINKAADLKGKIVATNAIGGAVDIASKKFLLTHGLQATRDYQVVEVQFPNMLVSIEEKKIDLATMIMPFSIEAHRQSNLKTLFTVGEAMGPAQTTLLVARVPFIAAHRAVLVDFFEDWIRALHWFYDPKNREQAIKIVADFTKKPPSEYSGWLFTHKDYYRNPNALPNLQALQNNLNTQKELGFLKIAIDVKKYADVSLVTEAAKRAR
ncbi:MAG: ABC transporter substrate-binding protein [Alphaproteobacteria bacterium]|nr:ABC transporter substrate-binding protein [Alphaproteobacteria bacterium]